MSLHHALKYAIPGYEILRPWWYWSNEPGNYFNRDELRLFRQMHPFLRGVGGHTTRSYANYESVVSEPVFYFTFLRDPIKRYLSHLNHQINKMGIDWSVRNFVEEPRFNNLMTRRIAGVDNVDLAKSILRDKFGMVGIFESYDESLLILSDLLFEAPTVLHYEHINDSQGESKFGLPDLSQELRDVVFKNNELDSELYVYAKDQLFARLKDTYSGDLQADLAVFKAKNTKYTYNAFKRYSLRIIRIYSENIPQRVAHWLKG